MNSRRQFYRLTAAHLIGVLLSQTFEFSWCETGTLLQRKQGDSSWQWLTTYKLRAGSGWSRDGVTGSYVVCDIASTLTNHTESWLVSEFIQSNGAKEITINLAFTTRECPISYPYCVQYYKVFSLFIDQQLAGGVTKQSIIDGNFTFIGNATASVTWKSGQIPQDNTVNVTQVLLMKGLYLAFQDIGSCIAIKEVSVTYKHCASITSQGVTFNKTFAPALRDVEVNVTGKCLDHATSSPTNASLLARCLASGDWKMDNSMACHCNLGFELVLGKCKACSNGMYKVMLGNHACAQCPSHTHSSVSRDQCLCDIGYYRATSDSANASCSVPPSKPRDLKTTMASPDVAIVIWSPPIDNGGRDDVKYDVICRQCISSLCIYACNHVTFWPANQNVTWTHVTISGVSAEVTYKIIVLTKNGVSDVAGVGFHANASVMVTIPALTIKLATTESPTNRSVLGTEPAGTTEPGTTEPGTTEPGTTEPGTKEAQLSNSAAIGISVACTFIFCLIVGLIIAYLIVLKYRSKVHLSKDNWTTYYRHRNDSSDTCITTLSTPRPLSKMTIMSTTYENHITDDIPEINIDNSSAKLNGVELVDRRSHHSPDASPNVKSKFDSKRSSIKSINDSTSSVRSWFPQNKVQYGI